MFCCVFSCVRRLAEAVNGHHQFTHFSFLSADKRFTYVHDNLSRLSDRGNRQQLQHNQLRKLALFREGLEEKSNCVRRQSPIKLCLDSSPPHTSCLRS
jgi:hypothetical protein